MKDMLLPIVIAVAAVAMMVQVGVLAFNLRHQLHAIWKIIAALQDEIHQARIEFASSIRKDSGNAAVQVLLALLLVGGLIAVLLIAEQFMPGVPGPPRPPSWLR